MIISQKQIQALMAISHEYIRVMNAIDSGSAGSLSEGGKRSSIECAKLLSSIYNQQSEKLQVIE